MGRGAYQPSVNRFTHNLINCVIVQKLEKNKNYTLDEIRKILQIPRNTIERYFNDWEVEKQLRNQKPAWRLRGDIEITKTVKGVRLEGCEYGPLGIIRRPIIPRWHNWIKNRPRTLRQRIQHLRDHPRLL